MTRFAISSLIPLLAACGSLAPQSNDTLAISSEPSGAEVLIMGERVGTTPLEVPVASVFPTTYPLEKETLYGRVVLRKEGCEEYRKTVSTGAIAKGLRAKLSCEPAPAAAQDAGDVRARLERLESLRRDGTISEQEYAAQRKRILGEL